MTRKLLELFRQEFPSWTPGEGVEAVCFRWKLFHWPQDSLFMTRAGLRITQSLLQGPDHLDHGGAACLPPST